MSTFEFDMSQLKKYTEKVGQLNDTQRDELMEDCAKTVCAALLRRVVRNTSVGVYDDLEDPYNKKQGGTLRRGWTGGIDMAPTTYAKTRVPVIRAGHTYSMTIENSVSYAPYVEYGHRQTPGRYVPALGKRLKASWVEGQYPLKHAEEDTNAKQKNLIKARVDKKFKEYLG